MIDLFLLFLLVVVHELSHYLTAKITGYYNGFYINKFLLGVGIKWKLPISWKFAIIILSTGFLSSIPFWFFGSWYFVFSTAVSAFDLALIFFISLEARKNPFYQITNKTALTFEFGMREMPFIVQKEEKRLAEGEKTMKKFYWLAAICFCLLPNIYFLSIAFDNSNELRAIRAMVVFMGAFFSGMLLFLAYLTIGKQIKEPEKEEVNE